MTKRKCGTCRFYQEARLASSGWCHHPLRKTTSDVLIMVRNNELACRDEWAHDLWQSSADSASAPTSVGDRPAIGRVPPATPDEIAAILRGEAAPQGDEAPVSERDRDDIVLSELGLPADTKSLATRLTPERDWSTLLDKAEAGPSTDSRPTDSGTRHAIIRAREAYRERARMEALRSSDTTRIRAARPTDERDESQSPVADRPRPSELSTLSAAPSSEQADAVGNFPSAPDPAKSSLTLEDRVASGQLAGERSTYEPVRLAEPQNAPAPTPDREVFQSNFSSRSLLGDAYADRGRESASTTREPSADASAHTAFRSEPRDLEPEHLPAASAEASPDVDQVSDFPATDDSIDRWNIDHQTASVRNSSYDQHLTTDVVYNNTSPETLDSDSFRSGLDKPMSETDEVLDDYPSDVAADPEAPSSSLAAHLTRVCRNCRDFRPAETGERGWCANQWAFSHRRMVGATEQAPCESSLGDWWLPVDEVWSDAADVSSHGQPTPLVDAWLTHQPDRISARRRS